MWFTSLVARGTQMICLSIGIINHAEPAGTSGSRSWRCVGWDRYVCSWGVWWQIWMFRFVGQDWQHIWHHSCLCECIVFGRAPSWLVVNVCELTSLKHIIAPVPMCHRINASLHQQLIPVYVVNRISEFYFCWVFTSLYQHRDLWLGNWWRPIE